MDGRKGLGLGLRALAAIVLTLGAGLLASSQVSAQDEAISIGRVTVAPGEQGTVDLEALNMSAPGLGAWEISILYDPTVVTPVDCSPNAASVCNLAFASNTVRVTGAAATGLLGDTTLASITFLCGRSEGATSLTLSLPVLADGTPGGPRDIDADAEHGGVTCVEAAGPPPRPTSTRRPPRATATEEEPAPTATPKPGVKGLPATGTGGGSGGGSVPFWPIAAVASAGLAAAGFGALRLRARRT